jgi:DNA polymerase
MHHLSIDLETYSSAPLARTGAYKNIHSPDFQILLFAYSLDGGPVELVDLAQGEALPPWLAAALSDPDYIKHAYNAAFEWSCLFKFMGTLQVDQWRCTMLHALYCGYPAGLEAVGRALGLPEDKQKLSSGKALIRYFCVPCPPTKTNGGRLRNLPHHDPAKWELFKSYCMGDVTAEMEILRRLSGFPVPDAVEKQWQTDLIINTRGAAVDTELVRGALEIGESTRRRLMDEAVSLSGLDNPNSLGQLTMWLENELGEELPNLRRDTVAGLLGGDIAGGAARRMLEIRQELSRTSTKKYDAIEAAACDDGRVRGLLQFYGANRTGRWAGRLVQVQNLPRTYVEPLALARDIVKRRDAAKLRLLYGSVPDTLSQLIRTAFTAAPGRVLIDADFSSIEARVLAWLADETWKLDAFRNGIGVYEATASQMFGVPLELIKKGNPEYALRQKGKVAELGLGYGMGAAKFKDTAERGYGIVMTEDEALDIVTRWRDANKRIRDLWYAMDAAAVAAVKTGTPAGVRNILLAREADAAGGPDSLTIRLPSGRKLYYAHPAPGVNRWGSPSLTYTGMDQTTKKWALIETYGGKLVENVTQAIARDCLADAIERLEAAGYEVVFHVHDEVVIDCPAGRASLDGVIEIMSQPLPWAPGLPLGADGWTGEFYRKD